MSSTSKAESLKVIEQTEIESLYEAIVIFNKNGIVSDMHLPYTRVIFNDAPDEVCQKLANSNFLCKPKMVGKWLPDIGTSFAFYNPDIYDMESALEWLDGLKLDEMEV